MTTHRVSPLLAKYGPAAVVTGAAGGIGAGFARCLAQHGFDLILTDIDADRLERTSQALRHESPRTIRHIAIDMRSAEAVTRLTDFTGTDDVGLLVCNHLYPGGSYQVLDTEPVELDHQLAANLHAYVDLAHTFGLKFRLRGRGGVILMSSLTAVVGSPYVTTYGASKAFLMAFGSGLGFELRNTGVDVLTLVASSVNTETYRRSAHKRSRLFPPMEVDDFVEAGLVQLGKRWVAVPGARNLLTASLLTRLLPRQLATAIMGRTMESMLRAR